MEKLKVLHRGCGGLLTKSSLLSEVWSPAVCSSAQKSSDFNYKNLPYHSKEWRVMNIKKKLHRLGRLNPTDSFYEDNLPSETHFLVSNRKSLQFQTPFSSICSQPIYQLEGRQIPVPNLRLGVCSARRVGKPDLCLRKTRWKKRYRCHFFVVLW